MSTKAEQIEAKRKKPIEVGDYVSIKVPYEETETITEGRGKKKTSKEVIKDVVFHTQGRVEEIYSDLKKNNFDFGKKDLKGIVYKISMSSVSVPHELNDILPTKYDGRSNKSVFSEAKYVHITFGECGANPFAKERRRISFYNQDISSLLFKACYGRSNDNSYEEPEYRNGKYEDGTTHGGVNFNPYIIDANGERQYYQRDLVWTLEQKQLLIDSIYNGIEIGKFLFRYLGWTRLDKERKETGHGHHFDCVDGKQRFFAILHFVQGKFPDSHGNYWKDLSPEAWGRFLHYANLSYGEMPEDATDNDVVENFLTLNFTGTPMSKEHIQFVQSFNMAK